MIPFNLSPVFARTRFARVPSELSQEKLLHSNSSDIEEEDAARELLAQTRKRLLRWKVIASALALTLVFVVLMAAFMLRSGPTSKWPSVYSPAEADLEYEIKVFHNNFHEDRTPYQGPPDDTVDQAWDDLYHDIGTIRITSEEAAKLPNKTLPIPNDSNHHIVGIEVFHQLHCLNFIRKALYPSRYGSASNRTAAEQTEFMIHLEHCVDNIRQTIQCYSDVSTIPWIWNPRFDHPAPDAHTTHVCRNFGKLQEWARARAFGQKKYNQILVENGIEIGDLT